MQKIIPAIADGKRQRTHGSCASPPVASHSPYHFLFLSIFSEVFFSIYHLAFIWRSFGVHFHTVAPCACTFFCHLLRSVCSYFHYHFDSLLALFFFFCFTVLYNFVNCLGIYLDIWTVVNLVEIVFLLSLFRSIRQYNLTFARARSPFCRDKNVKTFIWMRGINSSIPLHTSYARMVIVGSIVVVVPSQQWKL